VSYPAYFAPQYGTYNPIQPIPPRLEMYSPQQQQASQQTSQPPNQGLSAASRPVTSKEEAMGVAADFSGALMVFPDISHGRVFVKRWNFQSGAADFVEFAPVAQSVPQQEPAQSQGSAFASLQDLQDLQDIVENLQKEIDRLKKPAASGRAVKKNDASNDE